MLGICHSRCVCLLFKLFFWVVVVVVLVVARGCSWFLLLLFFLLGLEPLIPGIIPSMDQVRFGSESFPVLKPATLSPSIQQRSEAFYDSCEQFPTNRQVRATKAGGLRNCRIFSEKTPNDVLTLLALVLVLISCAILKHQIKLTHRSS
jgi:hypothetical protein